LTFKMPQPATAGLSFDWSEHTWRGPQLVPSAGGANRLWQVALVVLEHHNSAQLV